ncbi:MAG TPA: hypothetical protein VKA76_04935 [Gammaproteobacteria bacterium]|nr:hypothetical protein [Gammaproteobacteria bacterium]
MSHRSNDCYELLVAYVDGQLNRDEREYVLTLLEQEPELNRRAWELRQTKDMVEFAYEEVTVPSDLSKPPRPPRPLRFMTTWVAVLVLAGVGLAGYALVEKQGVHKSHPEIQARNSYPATLPTRPVSPPA